MREGAGESITLFQRGPVEPDAWLAITSCAALKVRSRSPEASTSTHPIVPSA
jgi:hypothetical protein